MGVDEPKLRAALKRINSGRSVRGTVLFATAREVVREYLQEVHKDEHRKNMVPLEFSQMRIHDHCTGNGCPDCDGKGYLVGAPVGQPVPDDEMPRW